jgi:hypothetical protein
MAIPQSGGAPRSNACLQLTDAGTIAFFRQRNPIRLRTGDALQLAAALLWSEGNAGDIVCLDTSLRDAAEREGFRVLPATA